MPVLALMFLCNKSKPYVLELLPLSTVMVGLIGFSYRDYCC